MDILKLPTDNLYIFLTIGGLFMFVFFVNKLARSFFDIKTRINKTENEYRLVLIESETNAAITDVRINVLYMHIESFEKKHNVKFTNTTDEIIENVRKRITIPESLDVTSMTNFINDYEKIIDYSERLLEENNIGRKSKIRYQNACCEIETLNTELKRQKVIYMCIIILSLVITIFGFLSWYSKNQKYQDGIIKAQFEQSISNEKRK